MAAPRLVMKVSQNRMLKLEGILEIHWLIFLRWLQEEESFQDHTAG